MKFQKMTEEEVRLHKGKSFPGVSTVFMCHDGKGKLLLAKRSKGARDEHGAWDPGAGGLDHGFSAEDNVRRELREEYDTEAKQIDFIGYIDAFRESPTGEPTHWLALFFVVLVDPKTVRINEPDKVEELGWFDLDNLPEPLHSQWDIYYDKLGGALREKMGLA